MSDENARRRKHESRAAYQCNCEADIYLKECERDSNCQSVDARCNCKHEEFFYIQPCARPAVGFVLVITLKHIPNHLASDKCKKHERNPVVKAGDIRLKLFAQKPSEERHQSLKSAEKECNHKCLNLV